MAAALILIPIVMAGVSFALPSNRWRPWLLPVTALVHLGITMAALWRTAAVHTAAVSWLRLDAPGRVVLALVSVLFFLCSIYAVGYLHYRLGRFNRAFCGCALLALAMMTLICWSQHLGLLWVAVEATTLTTAPLVLFSQTPRSLEATWKYLLISSVGIALALLGSFFLAYAALHSGQSSSLLFADLLQQAPLLSKPWLHAAFVLLLVGYGTKMGLAPMHTWKPDTYGETAGVVGGLLAGCVASCAFLALLRMYHICQAAGEAAFAGPMLVAIGLLSMAWAGTFMLGQRDFKRLLAYSSVEHMGILAIGLGLGPSAGFATMLHWVGNGLTKVLLFLAVGNLHRAFAGKTTDHIRGAMRHLPLSSAAFLVGFLAITGSPPFPLFFSELAMVQAFMAQQRYWGAGLFLGCLLLVFWGMGAAVLRALQGEQPAAQHVTDYRDGLLTGLPLLCLMGLILVLGVMPPTPLQQLLHAAAHLIYAPEVQP